MREIRESQKRPETITTTFPNCQSQMLGCFWSCSEEAQSAIVSVYEFQFVGCEDETHERSACVHAFAASFM